MKRIAILALLGLVTSCDKGFYTAINESAKSTFYDLTTTEETKNEDYKKKMAKEEEAKIQALREKVGEWCNNRQEMNFETVWMIAVVRAWKIQTLRRYSEAISYPENQPEPFIGDISRHPLLSSICENSTNEWSWFISKELSKTELEHYSRFSEEMVSVIEQSRNNLLDYQKTFFSDYMKSVEKWGKQTTGLDVRLSLEILGTLEYKDVQDELGDIWHKLTFIKKLNCSSFICKTIIKSAVIYNRIYRGMGNGSNLECLNSLKEVLLLDYNERRIIGEAYSAASYNRVIAHENLLERRSVRSGRYTALYNEPQRPTKPFN